MTLRARCIANIRSIFNIVFVETRLLPTEAVDNNLRKSGDFSEANRYAGSIFSFVPAHGGSRAGAVAEQLSRTLAEGPGAVVLLADLPKLERARRNHRFILADLSDLSAAESAEVMRASDAIFLVSGSNRDSLESVREKVEELHSMNVNERCALLLTMVPNGVSVAEAEEISGLPVCSLVDTEQQIAQLGKWLAANTSQPQQLALAG